MLSPYRVLDLSDERGQLAGLMLAQLGAEVIAVEPPGGSRSRTLGPFRDAAEGPGPALAHMAHNRGKQSIELDLVGSEPDRESFRSLAAGADVVIESGQPGEMAALGLDYDDLVAFNPALVYASITPFGRNGPKAQWEATDLTVWASAGPLVLTGDSDRPPARVPGGQAFAHGSSEAAGAIIAALHGRATTGRGCHIDVSAQEAAAQATQSTVLAAANNSGMAAREAGGLRAGGVFIRLLWPCADGHVSVTLLFGSGLGLATRRLMEVVHEEGHCDEATRDKDWIGYTELLFGGSEPVDEYERVKDCVGAFCMSHTKAELLDLAMSRGLLIAPVNTLADVVALPQFDERDYWEETGGAIYPGAMAKLSATPLKPLVAAPEAGAHTDSILTGPPRIPSAPPPTEDLTPRLPLEGLKILDFMWVMAGPAGTRVLSDLGATIVRVESSSRVDVARTLGPFKDGEDGMETSCLFSNLNAGKLGIALDPSSKEGREVIHDLVRWADVVTESFSPKAMSAWGLDYESLAAINPDIVMLSSCLFGQTGPLSRFAGYGTMASAVTGFFGVTGWPDRAPCGPFSAYTDYIAPRFANAALLAAIDHRRRTGEGQYIDFAQAEGALQALAPLILEQTVNGVTPGPRGNEDSNHHPHGVFACSGDDRWIALACSTDSQRAALSQITGGLDDDSITGWTSAVSGEEAVEVLQRAGVAAHVVADSHDILNDEHLADRGHLVSVPHPSCGEFVVEGSRFRLSGTPTGPRSAGPTVGQHMSEILTDILGYDEDRFVELIVSGAME